MRRTKIHKLVKRLMTWQCLSAILILFISGVHLGSASDRALRCQNRLVDIGADKSEVLEKCGEPVKVTRWEEGHNSHILQLYDYENDRYQAPKSIKSPIHMERWTYNLGSNKFIRYLDFENGTLIRIETGEKGTD